MKLWLGVLIAVAIFLGLRTGWRYQRFTEGDAIAMAAANYVETEARRGNTVQPTDCSGRPATGDSWVIVTCVPPTSGAGQSYRYSIDRTGHMTLSAPY